MSSTPYVPPPHPKYPPSPHVIQHAPQPASHIHHPNHTPQYLPPTNPCPLQHPHPLQPPSTPPTPPYPHTYTQPPTARTPLECAPPRRTPTSPPSPTYAPPPKKKNQKAKLSSVNAKFNANYAGSVLNSTQNM